MLTVDFDLLDVRAGHSVLDLGAGAGRHSFEALTRGAGVVAADLDVASLRDAGAFLVAMDEQGLAPAGAWAGVVNADGLRLPFPDSSFDRVIVSEVLEHVPRDTDALAEVARVLRPDGKLAVTVPRWGPEVVCWALSREYHSNPGGHIRIYRRRELTAKLRGAGFAPTAVRHVHALHSPYWWIRCAVGVRREDALPARLYHDFLAWDIRTSNPIVRTAERALDPLLGKSLVIYADRADPARRQPPRRVT